MSLFRIYWLRRLIRRNMTPMPKNVAATWQKRLSILYFLCAWNAFGFIVYQYYIGKGDWAAELKTDFDKKMTPAQSFARMLNVEKAKIIRIGVNTETTETDFKLSDIVDESEIKKHDIVDEIKADAAKHTNSDVVDEDDDDVEEIAA